MIIIVNFLSIIGFEYLNFEILISSLRISFCLNYLIIEFFYFTLTGK